MSAALEIDDFASQVSKWSETAVQSVAKDLASTVFGEVAASILEHTPVLTGLARGNWIPSVGDGSLETTEEVAGVDITGAPLTGNEQTGIDQTIAQFKNNPDATQMSFSNNLDYIGALDNGSSAKAPQGIVEPAIQASLGVLQSRGTI